MEYINRIVFGVFLFAAAWQDGKEKSIPVWLFLLAGVSGVFLCFVRGQFGLGRALSCLIGGILLLLSYLTDEAIGKGDGWFFIVSGLFLSAVLNLKLLIYGTFLNGIICGGIYLYGRLHGNNLKKKSVPFLPFLVPVWIGLVLL